MTRVAIHQPNYVPWAGYFHKLAHCDVFIFLDDAQFPKNSFVNRVKIRGDGAPGWLTVPAKPKLGTPIHAVVPGHADWPARHLDRLRNDYRKARHFSAIWPVLEQVYADLPGDNLCAANVTLIQALSERLGLNPEYRLASSIPNQEERRSDDRLIDLVREVGGDIYLSGKGGANYQSPEKFEVSGIALEMTAFSPAPYDQGGLPFEAGLSILDVLFHTGWDGAAGYVRNHADS
ncbi:MAG: WbqC family protein [Pseudomonadota bacterium]|nr:WbqC family protein [Pseudomonadota bacterium]